MLWWCFVRIFPLLLWVTKASKASESSILAKIVEDFRGELEDAELEVLKQHAYVFEPIDDTPPIFQMPHNFMHAFRPNSGVGNREDLIIEQLRELPVYDDVSFSKWRYFRFNNSDYLLGMSKSETVLWKKSIGPLQPLVLPVDDGIFKYKTERKGEISDSILFTRRVKYIDVLYVAVLTENRGSSFISIYEIIGENALTATVIDLGFSTKGYSSQPSSKMTDVQSRHGASLVVLVSHTSGPGIVYQQQGSRILNHYVEVHYPEGVDMVSFAINGHGYVAVTNKTVCTVFKMDEFVRNPMVFEILHSAGDIVDLEYFRLGFHHYLAVSAENVQTLYVWKRGGFFEKQIFQSTGVSQIYGALLPNCRDDVILMFVKTLSTPDLFVWNGQREYFVPVQVDIPVNFRPQPGTIVSSSYYSLAFILFLDATSIPKLFAISTSLRPVSDPVLIFGKEVSDLMQSLQERLSKQEATIREMSSVLINAVRPSGNQQFSALQIFNNLQSAEGFIADIGDKPPSIVWEGSLITLEDYMADTQGLELKMDALEMMLNKLESIVPDIVRIDEPAVITGQKMFTGDVTGSSVIARSLNVEYAGGLNIREIQKELYRLDKPTLIQGTLSFNKPLHISGNLDVLGTVNGIDISKDVLTTNTEQESNAEMYFPNKLEIKGDLSLTGKLNGIDIGNELITLHGDHVITGNKTFLGGIIADNVQADIINGVDVNRLLTKSLTKSGDQIIIGTKHFKGLVQAHDIALFGTMNSYNINKLADNVVRVDKPSVIYGHKTFVEDVIITSPLTVEGTLNGLKIPDDIFLKDKSNTITGEKTFSGIVTVEDVIVDGTVNGLTLPTDIITLSKNETIGSTLHFKEGMAVEKDIIVRGLVDGIDISQLAVDALQMNKSNIIENAVFLGEVTIQGDVFVSGFVNGVPLNDLVQDIVYKTEKNVVIKGDKTFNKLMAHKVQLDGLINGYNIERDFMTVTGDQIISGVKTFENSVTFQSLTTGDGMIDGINLTHVYKNRISLSIEDEVIDGDINFIDKVIVDGDLNIYDSLGDYRFPDDFVLKSTNQILANKEFTGPVIIDDLIVSGNLEVQGTLNGIKLPEFLQERVTLSADEDIVGDVVLGDATAEKVSIVGLVNGLNIVDFANNVMSLTKNQTVTDYKEFLGETKVLGSVTTEVGINGIDLNEINRRAFKLSEDATITVPVAFSDPVFFENLSVSGLINGVNLTALDADSVKTKGLQYIVGETTFSQGFHVEGDIQTTNVNGLNLAEDLLTKSTAQTIKGSYVFNDLTIEGDLQVSGLVNGMDLDETTRLLARKDKVNTIHSDLIFKEPVYVSGDLDVAGYVNGMNLKDVAESAMLKSGRQHVQGHKVLKGNVTVYGDINVTFVNEVHWGEFLEDLVRIDVPQIIPSRKAWLTDLEIHGDVYVSGFSVIESVNDINLTKFIDDAVFINRPAHIKGTKIFSNPVEITGDLDAALINGLNLTKDVIILQCTGDLLTEPQVITGEKTFQNLSVYGDIIVEGYVNGYKLGDLVANTLTTDGDQIITGHKRFHNGVTFSKDVYPKTVNGLVLSKDLVTLNTEQTIEGDITFTGDVHIQNNLVVAGSINGVDLEELAKDVLYADKDQDVDGEYKIENAVVKSDVFVEGLVNGINLNQFSHNITNFWKITRSDFNTLSEKSDDHCKMVMDMHSYLQHSYYVLDGFVSYQILNSASDYADVDVNSGELNLIRIGTSSYTADMQKYHFDSMRRVFDFMKTEQVKVIKRKSYLLSGKELTIQFEVEPKNSIVYFDGHRLPAVSHGFTDGDVVLQKGRAIIALLYATRSICEIFEIVIRSDLSFDSRPFGNIIVNDATSVSVFDISDVTYVAISYDSPPTYKERSKIYAYLKRDWQLVQNIPAAGSSRVLHFSFHGYNYLVFVNNVPVYKTKEAMAVQVYRNTETEALPFGLFQKIPFNDAQILETFRFGDLSELYLVISSETKVQVFRLEGESGFKAMFTLHGKCISSVKPFIFQNELYLIISEKDQDSMKQVSTVVYKGITQGWTLSSRKFEHCS